MKVILKRDVDNLGGAGDIVDVADGFGNNYLVPRGLAMRATKGAVEDAAAIRQARQKREARNLEEAEQLKARIESAAVTIPARAGEDGTLYGSVGNREVAEAVKAQLGIAIDRRRIPMERPFKELGEHETAVRLYEDVTATVRVEVVRGD
ncbi:MAG TPA: 50S ribosomal protein L9 [Egibacteraceae bacterium]|nr:50S ribosomal protein L9 [Actinomycetota bacterium]HWB72561.1 50S ribosomal protein L9 [Egibacteraceae bacterium]